MYEDIISFQNLCKAWREFVVDKNRKDDVAEFTIKLSSNISDLYRDLLYGNYAHGLYESFIINDPKTRIIHKATVRDRLLHHSIYRILYPIFDKRFIFDSYSCRDFKGTHKALNRFRQFARKVSKNHRRTCWVLKCDVRKCFASIDHEVLMRVLRRHTVDDATLGLLWKIISSFSSGKVVGAVGGAGGFGKGLPLGNLTSQLLVNIYLNELDQFIKHELKQRYYIRYADDFLVMHDDRGVLAGLLPKVRDFLQSELRLDLHPDKVSIETVSSGIDFLGWVHFPKYRVLRTTTKKRMFRNLLAKKAVIDSEGDSEKSEKYEATLNSYLGMLSHGNSYKLGQQIRLYNQLPGKSQMLWTNSCH